MLKLHGSLNWGRLKESDQIIPWHMNEYLGRHTIPHNAKNFLTMPVASQFHEWDQHANIVSEPEIVPPTWNKADYHRTLSKVWSRAAKELGEAENIFVIGYSLPESDSFFRYLYALGSLSDTPLRRFCVIDPDHTGNVEKRFQKLLGPGARDRFVMSRSNFAQAINQIKAEFPVRI